MVSVQARSGEQEEGPTVAGPGTPRGQVRSLADPSPPRPPLGPWSPPTHSVGAGRTGWTRGVLSRHYARRLRPRPRSLFGQLCARSLSLA